MGIRDSGFRIRGGCSKDEVRAACTWQQWRCFRRRYGGMTLRQVRTSDYVFGQPTETFSRWSPGVEVGTLATFGITHYLMVTPGVRLRHVMPGYAASPPREPRANTYVAVEIALTTQ